MAFTRQQKIKFRHCDPAGIVFYPRYFEMINDTVEAWFETVLDLPFAEIHPGNGVPTGDIHTRFTAPSHLGDVLVLVLVPTRIGQSSLNLSITARSADAARFTSKVTLIWVDKHGRATPWPDALRQRIGNEMESDPDNGE